MVQAPKVMLTGPSQRKIPAEPEAGMQGVQKEKSPDQRKARTRKMIATEARPMSDKHGKRQTLPQGTLPEQAGYLASCQKYATLKPDGFSENIKGYGPQVKIAAID